MCKCIMATLVNGRDKCVCVCKSGQEEAEESSGRSYAVKIWKSICRETRYPLLYWPTAYRFPVLRVQVCVYCAGLVLRVLGPKRLLSVYPTWVSGYCLRSTSLGSYNSLLNSPYFYVQKSVGISNRIAIVSCIQRLTVGSRAIYNRG
jgi:hypothetical protein